MDQQIGPVAAADDVKEHAFWALDTLDDFVSHAGLVGRELTGDAVRNQLLEATNRANQARHLLDAVDRSFIPMAATVSRLKNTAPSTDVAVEELRQYAQTLRSAVASVEPVDQLICQATVLATEATYDRPADERRFEVLGGTAGTRVARMVASARDVIDQIGGDAETIKRSTR